MQHLKTHYMTREFGSPEAIEQWKREGLIPNKVKFCDGLMLHEKRQFDFTKDSEAVDCKKCQKKINVWLENRFDLPY